MYFRDLVDDSLEDCDVSVAIFSRRSAIKLQISYSCRLLPKDWSPANAVRPWRGDKIEASVCVILMNDPILILSPFGWKITTVEVINL